MKATIKTHPIIETEIFYCESVSYASDYELGRFIPQYDEKVLSGYLTKKLKFTNQKNFQGHILFVIKRMLFLQVGSV